MPTEMHVIACDRPRKKGEVVLLDTNPKAERFTRTHRVMIAAPATFEEYKEWHKKLGVWKAEWDGVVFSLPFFYWVTALDENVSYQFQ